MAAAGRADAVAADTAAHYQYPGAERAGYSRHCSAAGMYYRAAPASGTLAAAAAAADAALAESPLLRFRMDDL